MIAVTSFTPGVAEILVILFLCAVSLLLTLFPAWRICSKAGFPGALSLLVLVPIANIALLFYLALAEWPALASKSES